MHAGKGLGLSVVTSRSTSLQDSIKSICISRQCYQGNQNHGEVIYTMQLWGCCTRVYCSTDLAVHTWRVLQTTAILHSSLTLTLQSASRKFRLCYRNKCIWSHEMCSRMYSITSLLESAYMPLMLGVKVWFEYGCSVESAAVLLLSLLCFRIIIGCTSLYSFYSC